MRCICYKRVVSRKYSQRGYQDSEGRDDEGRRSGPPSGRREGPRGRGLGAPTESLFQCARCGSRIVTNVGLETTCSKCGSDLHTCTNCRHFDTSVAKECRELVPARIAGKAKRNTCDLFAARIVKGFAADAEPKKDDPKAAFDALFDL